MIPIEFSTNKVDH